MKINAKKIDLIVYDFDGVLTNNKVYIFEDGKEAVLCARSDGFAIGKIKERGIPQIILSTEKNNVVRARAKKLNIEALNGVKDKKIALSDYCGKNKYSFDRIMYVGNDINDLEVMKAVGYSLAPVNANDKIKKIAQIIVQKKGGEGVIKEIFDSILKFS